MLAAVFLATFMKLKESHKRRQKYSHLHFLSLSFYIQRFKFYIKKCLHDALHCTLDQLQISSDRLMHLR